MDEQVAVAATTGVAQVFDLHALKAFAPDKRVRKMLFKTDQLWSEIACYEPGQSTVMHSHPKEEEAIFVLQGHGEHVHRRPGGRGAGGLDREVSEERAARRAQSRHRALRDRVPQSESNGAQGRNQWVTSSAATRRLPLNQMMFHVRRDARLRERWLTDFEASRASSG